MFSYFISTAGALVVITVGVRLFARRTFTTPKIRTFTAPKNRTFARRTTATPNFFSALAPFSWFFRFTAHGGHQGWEGGGA